VTLAEGTGAGKRPTTVDPSASWRVSDHLSVEYANRCLQVDKAGQNLKDAGCAREIPA
jgi:hypothetical protein